MTLILVTFQQHTSVIQALQTSLTLLFPLLLLRIAKYMEFRASPPCGKLTEYLLCPVTRNVISFPLLRKRVVIFYEVDDQ